MNKVWVMFRQMFQAWSDDYVPSMGAALAYYTMFSLAPLLLIVIAIAGLVFGQDAARGEIEAQLRSLMGEGSAVAVQELLVSVRKPASGLAATIVGVVLLLVGATWVFGELQDSLNRIWKIPVPSKVGGWIKLVRSRLLSFGMVLAMGFLLVVSLLVSAALAAAGSLVVVMLWVYYSAQIFLIGAEFTWIYANSFGSRRPQATVQPTLEVRGT
jgi:membrane protein